jgi:hypothetical protein
MEKSYKLGQTIVGARGRDAKVELARVALRRRMRRRNILMGGVCGAVLVGLAVWVVVGISGMIAETDRVAEDVGMEWVPTVEIVVEGGGSVSERIQEFVAKCERDFGDVGLGVERVVLPLGMSREVDVYVVDRVEYYKMSVDRGSAVQAEDAERMMRYLDERELVVSYVDLRVEGKAYYK